MGYNALMGFMVLCQICGVQFDSFQRNGKYCSRECRLKNNALVSGRSARSWPSLPTSTVGAVSELIVASLLLQKEYSVFRALSPACYCDLIAVKDGRVLNVEVRTGYVNNSTGKLTFPKRRGKGVNVFAVYERNSGAVSFLNLQYDEIEL